MLPTPQRWTTTLALLLLLLTLMIGTGTAAAQEATEEAVPAAEATVDPLTLPVAIVGEQEITVEQFIKRAQFERFLLIQQLTNAISVYVNTGNTAEEINAIFTAQPPFSIWYFQLQESVRLGNNVLYTMAQDALVRQKAQELGVTVSDDELTDSMNKMFGYDPAEPTSMDEAAQAREEFFAEVRTSTGLGENEIRDYFYMQALREKLRDTLFADLPHTTPYADVRHILVADEATANTILEALQSGGDFADLAQAFSLDTGSGANGGELGNDPVDTYIQEFADAVMSAEIGAFVGPVQSQFGWHILQVRSREDRPLDETEYDAARRREFEKYLAEMYQQANIQLYDVWMNFVPTEPAFSLDEAIAGD